MTPDYAAILTTILVALFAGGRDYLRGTPMKTIFESPNGKVARNNVGHTVETRGGEQLLIRDMAKELERLQEACEAISRNCDGPHSNCRDLRNDLKEIAQAKEDRS